MLDRMEAEAIDADVPVAATAEWRGAETRTVLQFGLNPRERTGFVGHVQDSISVVSTNDSGDSATVIYDYTGNERPISADSEIPLALVRRAVHWFADKNGARDDRISWRALG